MVRDRGYSRGYFYKLRYEGNAPDVIGTDKATRITDAADARWLKKQEAKAKLIKAPKTNIVPVPVAARRVRLSQSKSACGLEKIFSSQWLSATGGEHDQDNAEGSSGGELISADGQSRTERTCDQHQKERSHR